MKNFFITIRPLFGGRLKQPQVDGINRLLEATEGLPVSWRAYILATVFHETDQEMVPNVENLNYTTASRIRDVWPSRFSSIQAAMPFVRNPKDLANRVYNGRMGNVVGSDDGWNFRGRGLPHITGRTNYERASKELGVDFVSNPELVLQPDHAVAITVRGMTEGWFTGKKLSDYLPGDYINARRIINGVDKAKDIAGYARVFERGLTNG